MTEWVEVARRSGNHPLLNLDNWATAFPEKRVSKVMGLPFDFTEYRQFDGARWLSRENIEECKAVMTSAEKERPGFSLELATKFERDLAALRQDAEKVDVDEEKTRALSNEQLLGLLENWFEHQKQTVAYDYQYQVFVNQLLTDALTQAVAQKTHDVHKQLRYLSLFASPYKPGDMRKEALSLWGLAGKIRRGELEPGSAEYDQAIKQHLQSFAHLGIYFYQRKPYSVEDVKRRVEETLAKPESERPKSQEEVDSEAEKAIRELGLDEGTKLAIKAARKWAFVINDLDEAWNRYVFKLLPVLRECSRRLELPFEEFIQLRVEELRKALREGEVTRELVKELRERGKDHAWILEGGRVRVLIGRALQAYYEQEKSVEETFHHLKEIRGMAASPGAAKGPAKVVLALEDLDKVEKGDVLVSPTTTPAWTVAMEKAVAIVTDEGGLLCHASIVSREMGKPCVVGTKIGTRALRDGDVVEVNASKGIIRKMPQ